MSPAPNPSEELPAAQGDDVHGTPLAAARRVARNTGLQAGADIGSKLAILALYVVMARSLGQDGFGAFTFAISVVLFINLAGLGTDLVVTRQVARDRDEIDRLFWNTNLVKLLAGAAGLVVVIAIAAVGDYGGGTRVALAVLALAALVDLFAQTIQATLRGLEDFAPVAASLLIQRIFTAISAGAAMIFLDAGLVVVACLYLAASLVALVYITAGLLRRRIRPLVRVSRERARRLLAASIPLGAGAALGAVLARIDIVILSLLASSAIVGLYGAAYRLFDGTLFLTWAFGTAMLPMFSRLRRDTPPQAGRVLELGCKAIVGALLPIAAAFALFAGPLTEGLYGSDYADSASALRWLALPTVLYGPFVLGALVLTVRHRERVIGWVSLVGLIANVALNFVLIPPYSLNGAAAAMAASQVLLTALTLGFALQEVGRISPTRIMLGPLAGLAAMSAIALGLGSGFPQLALAALAYLLAAVAVERSVFPGDVRLLLRTVRQTRPVTAS